MATPRAGTGLDHAAGLVHAVIARLGGMRDAPLDPAHAERLDAVEEACRLVADAASESPRSLRAGPVAGLRSLALRLAAEMDGGEDRGLFVGDDGLRGLEAAHGSRPAALMGLGMALDAVAGAIGAPTAPAPCAAAVVWVPRRAARSWARRVDAGLARLERDALRADAGEGLRRDAWGVACPVAVTVAQVTDHACVDARQALARLAEAGSALSQAVARHASQSAAGAAPASAGAAGACLGMVSVVDEGVSLLRDALSERPARSDAVAWRMISRGRTGLAPAEIRALAGAGPVEEAGLRHEADWRAA